MDSSYCESYFVKVSDTFKMLTRLILLNMLFLLFNISFYCLQIASECFSTFS